MSEDKGVQEIANDVSEEISKEAENPEESPSTNEPADETGDVEKTQEETDTSEPVEGDDGKPIPYERFKQINDKYKQSASEIEELKSKIEEMNQPSEPQLTEAQLQELATQKGYKLSKAEQKEADRLQELLDTVENPKDRKWLENYAEAIRAEQANKFSTQYGEKLSKLESMADEYRLDRSERQARQLIDSINQKHGLSIDFEKDVDPELVKMISSSNGRLNKSNTDIYRLTREFLADKGVEFGRKLSQKEQQELNQKKKQAATESSSSTAESKIDLSKASLKDIFDDAAKKEGLGSF